LPELPDQRSRKMPLNQERGQVTEGQTS